MYILSKIVSWFYSSKREDYEKNFKGFYCPPSHILIHWEKDESLVILKGKRFFYEIDWKITKKLDKKIKDKNFSSFINNFIGKVQCVEAKITYDWPLHRVRNIKILLGNAIAYCLLLDKENSEKLLVQAEDLIESYRRDIIRYWTLLYSCIVFFCFIILALASFFLGRVIDVLWLYKLLPYIGAIIFGVIGSFVSICLRLGNVDYSHKTGRDIIVIETLCRILVGGISGLIVILMVMSGVLLPVLHDSNSKSIIVFIIAFVAGSSERFVPSIITHIKKSYSHKGHHK